MSEVEHYGGLFYVPEVQERDPSLLPLGVVAALTARPGDDLSLLRDRLAHHRKEGHLTPAARESGVKGAWLFDLGGVVLAAILLRLCELGIKNAEAVRAVVLAATTWTAEDFEALGGPGVSPLGEVIARHEQGERSFGLQLHSLAPQASGPIRYAARLYSTRRNEGTFWHVPTDGYDSRAVVSIDLIDILDRITARRQAH
ncbi:hypothetical protein [Hansschlegelia plantiphila]|uniref:Uncharacterized protein n=1 Tax=Hansschlegelia plantiphila TaxID=374655 RepID=A0A9W6IZK6_9HYPH|nr:hypothetical protein [Hansschlegelia plantiphila]GLK67041.1 hypothetical protein GCM10008179_06790 [Hansschlegelia plantiphila]